MSQTYTKRWSWSSSPCIKTGSCSCCPVSASEILTILAEISMKTNDITLSCSDFYETVRPLNNDPIWLSVNTWESVKTIRLEHDKFPRCHQAWTYSKGLTLKCHFKMGSSGKNGTPCFPSHLNHLNTTQKFCCKEMYCTYPSCTECTLFLNEESNLLTPPFLKTVSPQVCSHCCRGKLIDTGWFQCPAAVTYT